MTRTITDRLIGEIIDEYHVDGVVEMILTDVMRQGQSCLYKKICDRRENLRILRSIRIIYADQGQIATRLTAFWK